MDIALVDDLMRNCDPQLVLLVIDHMLDCDSDDIDSDTLLRYKFELLQLTERNDDKSKLSLVLHKDEVIAAEYAKRTQETKKQYGKMYEELRAFLNIYQEESEKDPDQMPKDMWAHLKATHNLDDSLLHTLYNFARLSYNCGMLNTASSCLEMCRVLLSPLTSIDYYTNCLWGKIAVGILTKNYSGAAIDIRRMNEHIDKMSFGEVDRSADILRQRKWLLYWSLFVFFRVENGLEQLLNFCLNDNVYLSTLQLVCPMLMRYLAIAAIVTSDRKRNVLDDIVRVFEDEPVDKFNDPVTIRDSSLAPNEFLYCEASDLLSKCQETVTLDYFAYPYAEEFMRCTRSLVFENFCRLHHCVGIGPVSEQLDLNWDQTESYILHLVKNQRLNAKIDSDKGNIVMDFNTVSPYETMINKFRLLQIKFDAFSTNYEKRFRDRY